MQQVKDLDGILQSWSLSGTMANAKLLNKSDLHLTARQLLRECFPTIQILEEVPIPLRRSETLYLDFYLPLIRKCIEVHGSQHYTFTPFYHVNRMGFAKHKKRDQDKKEWCETNGITYIELPFNEKIDQWKARLLYEQNS
jgi:hypothetical protein